MAGEPAGRILVVEDDRDIRETMVDALEDAGYRVSVAIDGIDALDRLRTDLALNLILLDMMMPRMTGIQVLAELRRMDAWARIPVVVVSADADGRERAVAMGAAGFLQKSMKLRELLAVVEQFIRP